MAYFYIDQANADENYDNAREDSNVKDLVVRVSKTLPDLSVRVSASLRVVTSDVLSSVFSEGDESTKDLLFRRKRKKHNLRRSSDSQYCNFATEPKVGDIVILPNENCRNANFVTVGEVQEVLYDRLVLRHDENNHYPYLAPIGKAHLVYRKDEKLVLHKRKTPGTKKTPNQKLKKRLSKVKDL